MFKVNNSPNVGTEEKNKNDGFVDDKGQPLAAQKPVVKDEPNPNDVDLNAKVEYSDDHMAHIEKGRLAFLKVVKKENIIKWIVALCAIGLLVFSWLYILGKLNIRWLGITMSVVSIGIIIAYYFIMKKYNDKKMNAYLKVYYADTNAYVFGSEHFKDVKGDVAGKIDNDEFNKSQLFKDVSTIGSRNIVTFKIGDANVKVCDCAAQQSTVKKLVPLFIGKYIVADNKCDIEEPIYVYLTGNSRALPPNNLDGLPKVMNTKKMVIYTKAKNYEKVLNANIRMLISNIVTNNILVDCAFAIHKGYTCIGMGYDDCLMVLPLNEKFNPIPMERYKKDMMIVADIIRKLN